MAEETMEAVEAELGPGGVKFKTLGTNVVPLLTLLMVTIMLYGGYKHDADGAQRETERNNNIVGLMKEQIQIQRENLNAQREANCLARLDPKSRRDSDIEYCRSLGRGH